MFLDAHEIVYLWERNKSSFMIKKRGDKYVVTNSVILLLVDEIPQIIKDDILLSFVEWDTDKFLKQVDDMFDAKGHVDLKATGEYKEFRGYRAMIYKRIDEDIDVYIDSQYEKFVKRYHMAQDLDKKTIRLLDENGKLDGFIMPLVFPQEIR